MVQGCGNKCLKYIFWAINFLFFILGAIIVGLSIWMLVDKNSLNTVASSVKVDLSQLLNQINVSQINAFFYVAIAVGAALLLLGFLGCCGSCCENNCFVITYSLLVFLLAAIEVVAIILYFVFKNTLQEGFANVWRSELISKYNSQTQIRQVLDQIQSGLQCCGASGCSDYIQYGAFPSSCQCATVQQPGCATMLWTAFEANLLYVGVVVLIVLIVEIIALCISCCVCSAIKDKNRNA